MSHRHPIASRQTQALHLIHIGTLRLEPGLLRLRQVALGPEIHQRNLHEVVDLLGTDGEDRRNIWRNVEKWGMKALGCIGMYWDVLGCIGNMNSSGIYR